MSVRNFGEHVHSFIHSQEAADGRREDVPGAHTSRSNGTPANKGKKTTVTGQQGGSELCLETQERNETARRRTKAGRERGTQGTGAPNEGNQKRGRGEKNKDGE